MTPFRQVEFARRYSIPCFTKLIKIVQKLSQQTLNTKEKQESVVLFSKMKITLFSMTSDDGTKGDGPKGDGATAGGRRMNRLVLVLAATCVVVGLVGTSKSSIVNRLTIDRNGNASGVGSFMFEMTDRIVYGDNRKLRGKNDGSSKPVSGSDDLFASTAHPDNVDEIVHVDRMLTTTSCTTNSDCDSVFGTGLGLCEVLDTNPTYYLTCRPKRATGEWCGNRNDYCHSGVCSGDFCKCNIASDCDNEMGAGQGLCEVLDTNKQYYRKCRPKRDTHRIGPGRPVWCPASRENG